MNGDQRPPWEQAIDDAMAGGMSSAAPPAALPQEQRPSWEGAIDAALSGRAQAPGRAPVRMVVWRGASSRSRRIYLKALRQRLAPRARPEDIGKGFGGGSGGRHDWPARYGRHHGQRYPFHVSAAGVPDRVLDVGKSMAGSGTWANCRSLWRAAQAAPISSMPSSRTPANSMSRIRARPICLTLGDHARRRFACRWLAARAVNTVFRR